MCLSVFSLSVYLSSALYLSTNLSIYLSILNRSIYLSPSIIFLLQDKVLSLIRSLPLLLSSWTSDELLFGPAFLFLRFGVRRSYREMWGVYWGLFSTTLGHSLWYVFQLAIDLPIYPHVHGVCMCICMCLRIYVYNGRMHISIYCTYVYVSLSLVLSRIPLYSAQDRLKIDWLIDWWKIDR